MCDLGENSDSLKNGSEQEEKSLSFASSENVLQRRRRPVRKQKKVVKAENMDSYSIPYLRKGRQDLPLREKIKILEMLETDPKIPQRMIASTFKVSQSQISRIQNNKEKITKAWQNGNVERRRNRKGKGGMIELRLLEWYNEAKREGLPISGPTLMEKAKNIGEELNLDFTPTSGWFGRWKNRNGITLKLSKNQDGSLSLNKISSHWRRYTFTKAIKDYDLENVWFLDSLSLFSNALPEDSESTKMEFPNKGRVSMLFAFNYLSTDRREPMIVGTEQIAMDTSHFIYCNQPQGNVTKDLFTKWFIKWDKELRTERRKISLFLCRAPYISENLSFHSISLHYFPEGDVDNLRLQPFHFGISATFKALFRYQIASHYFSYIACKELRSKFNHISEEGDVLNSSTSVSLLDRLHMIRRAWKHIHPDIFIKGIVKAGLSKQVQSLNIETSVDPPHGMNREEFQRFVHIEDCFSGIDSKSDDGAKMGSQQSSEVTDFEALLACNILRKYLQRKGSNLVDQLAEVESEVQRNVLTVNDQSVELQSSIDPFFDPSSIHSMEGHKTSIIKQETLKVDAPIELPNNIVNENPPNHNRTHTETFPNNSYTNTLTTTKYSGSYSNPSNSHEVLLPQPHGVNDNLKTNCDLAPLTHGGQPSHVGQYQTTANYIPQNVELKSIPLGVPRTISDVNLDRFTIHPEVQHARTVNEINPHIIPATQLTNQAPTFITFASHF